MLFLFLAFLFSVQSQTQQCETYNVSTISYALSGLPFIRIPGPFALLYPIVQSAFPYSSEMQSFVEAICSVLSLGFIICITALTVLLVAYILMLTLQLTCNVFSTPNHFYWIWHVRLLLVSCIVFAFLAAIVGATGLYGVSTLYGKAREPITCFDQIVTEKVETFASAWDIVLSLSQQFHVAIPTDISRDVNGYLSNTADAQRFIARVSRDSYYYSKMLHFALATLFGLVIALSAMMVTTSLKKSDQNAPRSTLFVLLVSFLFAALLVSVASSSTVMVSKTCVQGIDVLANKYADSLSLETRAFLSYYLFCSPWPNNPLNDIIALEANFPMAPVELQQLNHTLTQALDCQITSEAYKNAKQALCWDINNDLIEVTQLVFIAIPILILMMLYTLIGWKSYAQGQDVIYYETDFRDINRQPDDFAANLAYSDGLDLRVELDELVSKPQLRKPASDSLAKDQRSCFRLCRTLIINKNGLVVLVTALILAGMFLWYRFTEFTSHGAICHAVNSTR